MTISSIRKTETLQQLSLDSLQRYSCAELQNFDRIPVDNLRFGHELLHRAVMHNDEQAWASVEEVYQPLVSTWISAKADGSLDEASLQQGTSQAFRKLRAAFVRNPHKFYDFPTLIALLGLLRLCAEQVTPHVAVALLAVSVALGGESIYLAANRINAKPVTARTTHQMAGYRLQTEIDLRDEQAKDYYATTIMSVLTADEHTPANDHCHPSRTGSLCII